MSFGNGRNEYILYFDYIFGHQIFDSKYLYEKCFGLCKMFVFWNFYSIFGESLVLWNFFIVISFVRY